jgi:2,3,4,5-tetrahydropyridine-2,6-dicarboxylate N-succinyltransferase
LNDALQRRIDALYGDPAAHGDEARRAVADLLAELDAGRVRAADNEDGRWVPRPWVKRGILLGFRIGTLTELPMAGPLRFLDKDTFPLKTLSAAAGVRIVPGGTSVRRGVYLAPGVILMPPSYVNVGAYVDAGTMIDSHALVGSCAQVGKRVHISAGAQVGGVLEPVGALPVILEDDVLVGGSSGIYEGAILRAGAVVGAGVILTASTPVYDVVRGQIYRRTEDAPLEIPAGAVVVPGARVLREGRGAEWGLSLQTPVIVKYRDGRTDGSAALESLLR